MWGNKKCKKNEVRNVKNKAYEKLGSLVLKNHTLARSFQINSYIVFIYLSASKSTNEATNTVSQIEKQR